MAEVKLTQICVGGDKDLWAVAQELQDYYVQDATFFLVQIAARDERRFLVNGNGRGTFSVADGVYKVVPVDAEKVVLDADENTIETRVARVYQWAPMCIEDDKVTRVQVEVVWNNFRVLSPCPFMYLDGKEKVRKEPGKFLLKPDQLQTTLHWKCAASAAQLFTSLFEDSLGDSDMLRLCECRTTRTEFDETENGDEIFVKVRFHVENPYFLPWNYVFASGFGWNQK